MVRAVQTARVSQMSSMHRLLVILAAFTVLPVPPATASQVGADIAWPDVSLEEALQMAARSNPRNEVSRWSLEAASAQRKQARSYFLPTVGVQASALWWDDSLYVELADESLTDVDCTTIPGDFGTMCESLVGSLSQPWLLREQATQSLELKAVQPITSLYNVQQGLKARRALEQAEEAQLRGTESSVALEVVKAYFKALEVRHLEEVASAGTESLQAHLQQGQAFLDAGIIGRNELLQIQVALAETRLDLTRARKGLILAERNLAFRVGATEPRLVPHDLPAGTLPPLEVDSRAMAAQVASRYDVAALSYKAQAALAARNAARADLVPQVAALATWERYWGLGDLTDSNAWYVGLGLEWDVWDWGRTYQQARQADAQANQASAGLRALREGALMQASSALNDAEIALEAYQVSKITKQQAEENLRIVNARFESHMASATDLLDAEALALKARSQQVSSYYDYLVDISILQDALGLPIDPMTGVLLAGGASP